MSLMNAFSEACGEFPAFRAAVVKARDLAADSGTRQQLDHLLDSLDHTYADFQQTFPKAVNEVQQTLNQAQQQALRSQADVASMEEALAKHEAAEAAKAAVRAKAPITAAIPAAAPVLPTLLPLDFQQGLRLRDELLKLFGISTAVRPGKDDGSVASMDSGAWTQPASEVAADWPEELRAPSYKKQTTPDKNVEKKQPPKPRPQPSSDDESIGKGWDDDDL